MEDAKQQDLMDQIARLKKELEELKGQFYSGNFSSSQDFNKYVRMNARFKIPHYDTLPTTCEVGEICEIGVAGESGTFHFCEAPNTWA